MQTHRSWITKATQHSIQLVYRYTLHYGRILAINSLGCVILYIGVKIENHGQLFVIGREYVPADTKTQLFY